MKTPHEHDQSCREMFEMLSEYVDGELPADTCEEIEAHMKGCSPCIQFVDSFRSSIRMTREFCVDEHLGPMPEELRRTLERAYENSLRRRG
jgi:anti-sigma factor (TIGR02949 family)